MKKILGVTALLLAFSAGAAIAITTGLGSTPAGYVLERDREVRKNEPGPHDGGGRSTGYSFFEKVPDLKYMFKKRVLHPGAAIGYHLQKVDEVYYIIGGQGTMTINDQPFTVKPGDAVLTRSGSSHGLKQRGQTDLTLIITYPKE